jgi:hypothetical protein
MSARLVRVLVAVLSLGLVLTRGSVASASAGSNTATRPAASTPKASSALFYVTLYGYVDNPTPKRDGHYWRIDLWAGGNSSDLKNPGKAALLACEDALTQDSGGQVTLNPASSLPVDTTPIFNTTTNKCYQP